ncbi:hypothetical protein RYX36_005540 [Vicia faba]
MLSTIFSYNATDMIFSIHGEHWRQLRKICAIELFSAKRVQSFKCIREEEVSDLVKSIAASEGSVVNLTQKISDVTHGIVARAAFGKKNKHAQAFKSAIDEIVSLMGGFCIADLYPSIKMFQRTSTAKKKFEKLHREIDMIMQDIVDDHKNIHREVSKDEDLVDALLKIQQENENSQHRVTDVNVKSIILDIFGAGTETTSGIKSWCMSEMVKNPKVLEEAQAELLYNFNWKLPNNMKNEELDMTESFGISARIKHDLCLIPIVRRL